MSTNAKKKYNIIVGVFLCLIIAMVFGVLMKPKEDNASVVYIKQEFNKIKPIEGAVLYKNMLGTKYLYAIIGADYKSDLTEKQIIDYYNEELEKYGWTFITKKNEKDIYGIYNGPEYYYKKNFESKYTLSIFFPTKAVFSDGEMKYNFSLRISRDIRGGI